MKFLAPGLAEFVVCTNFKSKLFSPFYLNDFDPTESKKFIQTSELLVTMSCEMDFTNYPYDSNTCPLELYELGNSNYTEERAWENCIKFT